MNFYNLYHGDSREVLKQLDSNSVDMVITDPPYGFGKFRTDDENCVTLTRDVLKECSRVMKEGAFALVFAPTNQTLIDMINESPLKFNRLLWMNKPNDMTFPWARWLLTSEAIMVFTNGKANMKLLGDVYHSDTYISNHGKKTKWKHPTMKPLEVIEEIVKSSPENGVILDPFLGSGTTMFACQNLRRSCIGIELESEHVETVKKRCFGRQFLTHQVKYEFYNNSCD